MSRMLDAAFQGIEGLFIRGGWVMWPLVGLSILALALIFERCWFWVATNTPWRRARVRRIGRHLREGQRERAAALLEGDRSVYGVLLRRLMDEKPTDAAAADALEQQRPRIERFMPTLGTIITAAPMLGILGTVTGIISAFRVLSDEAITDPSRVGAGIAEALLTTVAGLVVAIVVLFPYNAFRAQIDRTLGRMETLAAAAQEAETPRPSGDHAASPDRSS